MAFIREWMTAIILVIVLAMILEMLLPNTALKNYVKLVISFMLLLLLLQPVLALFQYDVDEWLPDLVDDAAEQQSSVGAKINSQKKEIEQFYDAYTSEQVAVQFKEQVAEKLRDTYQLAILDVHVDTEKQKEDWQGVTVTVGPAIDEEGIEDSSSEPIQTVSIDVSTPHEARVYENEEDVGDGELKSFLATEWEIPETFITIARKDARK